MPIVKFNVTPNPYYKAPKVLDGNEYYFTFKWSVHNQKWYMSMTGINNTIEINGIALVGGVDLFEQFGYRELGQLRIVDNQGVNEDPNFDEMGSRFTLEYTTLE